MAEERKKILGWFSAEAISLIFAGVAGVVAFESLSARVDVQAAKAQQLDRDNAQLKEQLNEQGKVINQINLNVATLLERTAKPGKP